MNVLTSVRRTIATLVAVMSLGVAFTVHAAEDGPALDTFPMRKLAELPALQDGARTFVNYCLNCHNASMMRYNRLRDIGLSEAQIAGNLILTGRKVGDLMQVAIRPNDAKEWFGALPPDLSVIARARSSAQGSGADWIYTYLRSYYRDDSRATGWNNSVFPNVGMPHVLWEWQGSRGAVVEEIKSVKDEKTGESHGFNKTLITYDNAGTRLEKTEKLEAGGHPHEGTKLTLTPAVGGTMNQASYDEKIANLVGFIAYMSDPTARTRVRMGVWVLMFLGLLVFLTWWLNREYWKDIK